MDTWLNDSGLKTSSPTRHGGGCSMITIAEGTSNTPTNQMVSDTRKQSILRMHATTTQKEERQEPDLESSEAPYYRA